MTQIKIALAGPKQTGIAADPVARLSASLLFYMAMRITVDVPHHSLGVRFGSKAEVKTLHFYVRFTPKADIRGYGRNVR